MDCETQYVFFFSSLYLSTFYHIGISGAVSPNLEKSVSILNNTLLYTQDEVFRKHLQDELAHYKKKVFGGYKYI